jgi:3,4-dihydroxy 2-butanone 4-phosphate synthase
MNADGPRARGAQGRAFAQAHGLACTTVQAIAEWRRATRL